MKKITTISVFKTLLFAFLFSSASAVQAQGAAGTDDDGFFVQIKSPASIAQVLENTFQECGWVGSTYGPSLTEELCGEVVWIADGPDSLGCTAPAAGSLSGKIAFVRRGVCNFSEKVFNAQKAGAIAVIVANHHNNVDDGDCFARQGTLFFGGMSGGTNADSVAIPSVFIQRLTGKMIADALDSGQKVEVCFTFPRMATPFAEYTYASPASQAQPLANLAFNFFNREAAPITNMTVTAAITEPGGNVVKVSQTIPEISVGADTLIGIDGYTPPAVEGEFNVAFYTDRYSEPQDTLHRKFVHTKYTYAVDNMNLLPGLGLGNGRPDLFLVDLVYTIGALAFTGPNGGKATYCSFGVDNIDSVYVAGNDIANTLNISLSKFDADGNGFTELESDFSDLELVGIASYVLTGSEKPATLIDVELRDLDDQPGVTLDPNEVYVLSISYDGVENGSGRPIGFSNSAEVDYLAFLNESGTAISTAPARIGGNISSWGGATAACRLQLEGYQPTISVKPEILDASKYAVSPNPASEFVVVDLNLEKQGSVHVSIANALGQRFQSRLLKDFQSGKVTLDVKNIPSGSYALIVNTGEGYGVKKIVISH